MREHQWSELNELIVTSRNEICRGLHAGGGRRPRHSRCSTTNWWACCSTRSRNPVWCGSAITSSNSSPAGRSRPSPPRRSAAGCGLSEAEAARLAAAIELARRLLWPDDGLGPIRSPRDACRAAAGIRSADREHFLVLYLNARNVVMHQETVSIGSLNANIVHPREVFRPAITRSAAAIILAHNHPSGDVTPSQEDLNLTATPGGGGPAAGHRGARPSDRLREPLSQFPQRILPVNYGILMILPKPLISAPDVLKEH